MIRTTRLGSYTTPNITCIEPSLNLAQHSSGPYISTEGPVSHGLRQEYSPGLKPGRFGPATTKSSCFARASRWGGGVQGFTTSSNGNFGVLYVKLLFPILFEGFVDRVSVPPLLEGQWAPNRRRLLCIPARCGPTNLTLGWPEQNVC